ncbi:apolipoprotein N-acyltransferase [Nocardioides lianchengensis]|uniref:apolipoprotein N-acyltransferase n=1 Tax=Nocardioides lianchengensis TaxID=1045774 RepID=UPI0017B4D236|nr:apolipoprotein N-acyltransferase [Nocardioides lianchengensis]NYG10009.1 apolipoprotein N-acyltransferase [Nocardioides lianchengensis]
MLKRILLALVAGVVLSLAFEPVAAPIVLPFAVAGFFLSVRGLRARQGWWVGLVFGVSFYYVHIWWMHVVALPAWLALAGIEAFFYGVLGAVVAVLGARRWWPLWVTAAWVAVEVLRSGWPFSGMPWGRLAFATVDTPVAASLPYVGMVGVTALLALAGALLAWLVVAQGRERRFALGAVAALVAVLAVPALASYTPDEVGSTTVAVVQGDVPGPGNDILYDPDGVTENHVRATVDLADDVRAGDVPAPDFVVWPENSTASDPFNRQVIGDGIREAVAAVDVPVLVGAIVDGDPGHVLNQGIVWDPVTGAGERYTKQNPVPWGEYIPFRKYLDYNIGDLSSIGRDMLRGTREEPLTVAGVRIADAICFDVAYDGGIQAQLARGAELMVVQTSNASFMGSDQIDQQFAITRLRAIETGRWLTVASTNGLSGIVAPDGTVVATADPRTTAVLVEEVGLVDDVPPGIRVGPWVARLCIAATLAGLVLAMLTYRRRRTLPRPVEPGPDGPRLQETKQE